MRTRKAILLLTLDLLGLRSILHAAYYFRFDDEEYVKNSIYISLAVVVLDIFDLVLLRDNLLYLMSFNLKNSFLSTISPVLFPLGIVDLIFLIYLFLSGMIASPLEPSSVYVKVVFFVAALGLLAQWLQKRAE